MPDGSPVEVVWRPVLSRTDWWSAMRVALADEAGAKRTATPKPRDQHACHLEGERSLLSGMKAMC